MHPLVGNTTVDIRNVTMCCCLGGSHSGIIITTIMLCDIGVVCLIILVLYFLDFFLRVLLIYVPAKLGVQFEGGNKTWVGSISHSTCSLECWHVFSADLTVLRCMHAVFYIQY